MYKTFRKLREPIRAHSNFITSGGINCFFQILWFINLKEVVRSATSQILLLSGSGPFSSWFYLTRR